MQLENSFSVDAPPDRVFAYLLDINKVVGCVPGAELSEVVDSTTFKGKVLMKVDAEGAGSVVKISTDYSVAGRVAQFGRGVMEDVSRRIINEMAACIKANVEGGEQHAAAVSGGSVSADAPAPAPVTAKPVNAVS